MARILPDVARGFGPIVPQRQRFMMKKQSDEDKALKIIQAISGGVGTAAQLYKVGSDIYEQYIKETPEEALRRRQEELGDAEVRQNIARSVLGGGMEGGQYDPMLGSRRSAAFGEAQKEFASSKDYEMAQYRRMRLGEEGWNTVIPGLDSRLDRFTEAVFVPPAEGEVRTRKPAPFKETPEGALDYLGTPAEAAAPAPATTSLDESEVIGDLGKLARLLPQYAAQRGMNVAEAQKMIATGDWQGLGPGSTETFGQYLDRMQQSGRFGGSPQAPQQQAPAAADPVISRYEQALQRVLTAGGKPELVDYLAKTSKKVAAEKGRPDLVPQMDAITAKYKESLTPRAQATLDYIQRPRQQQFLQEPRTAREFVMGRESGREFSIRELNMAYNSLWRQGRQQEAEDLVRLAGAAKDIGQFVQSGTDSPVLVRARAEEAVAKMAKGGADRLSAAQAISLAKMKEKRSSGRGRGSRTGAVRPEGSPKEPTPEERNSKDFLIVVAEKGIRQARDLYYDSKTNKVTRQTTKDILAEARRILNDVAKQRFRTHADYALLRSEYGQDFYETATTEEAVSEEVSAAEQALSEAIGLPIEDFGDYGIAAENRIREMERQRDKLPKNSDPQPDDYTLPEIAKSLKEFKTLAPEDAKSQTAEIRKRKAAQVKERKSLDAKITRAKNALRTLLKGI